MRRAVRFHAGWLRPAPDEFALTLQKSLDEPPDEIPA